MDSGIALAWSQVLGAIVDGPRESATAAEIAGVLECSLDDIQARLDSMIAHELIASWVRPGRPDSYTLTPFTAETLDVVLTSNGIADVYAWAPRQARVSAPKRARGEPPPDPLADLADDRPGPAERAEAAEAAARWRPRGPVRVDQLPRPTVLLTGCRLPWTERTARVAGRPRAKVDRASRAPTCSACGGAPLAAHVYCLRCDRWGLDGLAARQRRAEKEAERAQADKPAAG